MGFRQYSGEIINKIVAIMAQEKKNNLIAVEPVLSHFFLFHVMVLLF